MTGEVGHFRYEMSLLCGGWCCRKRLEDTDDGHGTRLYIDGRGCLLTYFLHGFGYSDRS